MGESESVLRRTVPFPSRKVAHRVLGKDWWNLSSYYGVVWVCSINIRTSQNATHDSCYHFSSLLSRRFVVQWMVIICSEGSSSNPAIILICNQWVEVDLSRLWLLPLSLLNGSSKLPTEWVSPLDDKEWPRLRLALFSGGGWMADVGWRICESDIVSNANLAAAYGDNPGDTKGGLSVVGNNSGEDHSPGICSSLGTPDVSFFIVRGGIAWALSSTGAVWWPIRIPHWRKIENYSQFSALFSLRRRPAICPLVAVFSRSDTFTLKCLLKIQPVF